MSPLDSIPTRYRRFTAAALALVALVACGDDAERAAEAIEPPLVEAVAARFGALPVEETLPGVVRARDQVTIRPRIEARVAEVLVRSGETVQRGQPLVRLEENEIKQRLRQAEASVRLEQAAAAAARARVVEHEARVVRSRALAAEELISAQELEVLEAQLEALRASAAEAAARVEQAEATVEERRAALAETVVRSPVDGRVGERRVEEGMLVDRSTVLFVAGGLDELIVEVTLTEEMLSTVEEGLPVVIEPRGGAGQPIRAELSRISPFLAEESFTTVGEIDVDNRGGALRPGMFVNVRILVGESRSAVLIPVAAVWEDPASGERGVFVVEDASGLEEAVVGTAAGPEESRAVSFRRVDILAEGRNAVGVDGIAEGAWVVTVGQHLLGAEARSEMTSGATDGSAPPGTARVRPVTWERVVTLQSLQDEDLLESFLDKQRKVAAALGAEIPESEDDVDRVLEEAAMERAQPGGG